MTVMVRCTTGSLSPGGPRSVAADGDGDRLVADGADALGLPLALGDHDERCVVEVLAALLAQVLERLALGVGAVAGLDPGRLRPRTARGVLELDLLKHDVRPGRGSAARRRLVLVVRGLADVRAEFSRGHYTCLPVAIYKPCRCVSSP